MSLPWWQGNERVTLQDVVSENFNFQHPEIILRRRENFPAFGFGGPTRDPHGGNVTCQYSESEWQEFKALCFTVYIKASPRGFPACASDLEYISPHGL